MSVLRNTALAGLTAVAATCAAPVLAQDRADIDRTQIIGNRELPKVLYIVPWKKAPASALSGRPDASVLDEVLAPLDRDVFQRQLLYDALTRPSAAATATGDAGAARRP